MKLPWYMKSDKNSKEVDGKLCMIIHIRKIWIYMQYVKYFFKSLKRLSWQSE